MEVNLVKKLTVIFNKEFNGLIKLNDGFEGIVNNDQITSKIINFILHKAYIKYRYLNSIFLYNKSFSMKVFN